MLGARWLLLHLLDKQVKHLGLEELLDKVPRGLGLDGLVEGSALEHPRLAPAVPRHVQIKMANSLHEEGQEGFQDHAVQLLHS